MLDAVRRHGAAGDCGGGVQRVARLPLGASAFSDVGNVAIRDGLEGGLIGELVGTDALETATAGMLDMRRYTCKH